MRRGLKTILLMVPACLLVAGAFAQTGKIVGRVTDAATGEPLPGVNVLIEGTTQGTATNLDGEYVIIGVRPGTYTIVASFIGYRTERRTGVQVNVDLTTRIDFQMAEEVIEGEEIVVTAEAEGVRKDVTSSEARVTSETIDRLPVNELSQVLDVQAGITTRGGIHIRGGRSSEITYMVDGVPVTDSYDGSAAIQVENDGIQELQVISGTFNAEFGNAMSGVINVVTKEGRGDRFGGSAEFYTGSYLVGDEGGGGKAYVRGVDVEKYTVDGIQYRDVDPYSYLPVDPAYYYNARLSLEGPLFSDRATLFVLGRYFSNDGWLYGADIFNTDGTLADSSLTPLNTFEKFSWQGNLRVRLSNSLILNVIGLGSFGKGRDGGQFWRWAPNGRPRTTDNGFDTKLKLTHLLSATAFYTLSVASFFREIENWTYDDPFDPRYNDFLISPPDSVEVIPGSGQYMPVVTGSNRFARGGTALGRFTRKTRTYLVKGDLSSQFGRYHLVKTGFQVKIDEMSATGFGLIPKTDENGSRLEPFEPAIPPVESPAFNSFRNVRPVTVSAYVQDKIEFESFIVNAGLRFDYFDARSRIPADPEDPNIFNPLKKVNQFNDLDGNGKITDDEERDDNRISREEREAYWWKSTSPKTQLSPRLGIAYPITEQGVVHFSYGIFFQIPSFVNLFDQFGYKVGGTTGTYGPFGNPDLKPQKTTMYELGFKQGFGDFVLDVTVYNRDIRNWVSTSVVLQTARPGVNYTVFTNRDYANTRGVTLTLKRNFVDHFGFDLNYTFQVVEGSNSNPADELVAIRSNREPALQLLPLDWDQRHKIAGAIYFAPSSWGGSLRFRFGSGFPYTPSFPEAALFGRNVAPTFPRNSRRIPSTFEVDLNVYKEFDFGSFRPRLFAEVFNVLDTRNVEAVFSDTGKPDVTVTQFQTGSFDPGFFVRPDFYREPRRIQVGIQFTF